MASIILKYIQSNVLQISTKNACRELFVKYETQKNMWHVGNSCGFKTILNIEDWSQIAFQNPFHHQEWHLKT